QNVSREIAKRLDDNLTAAERTSVKDRLNALNVHMYAYHVDKLGADDRKTLEFAKDMGAAIVVAPVDTSALEAVDKLAGEVGINIAVETRNRKVVDGRSAHMGLATDTAAGDRLMALEFHNS